jgi:acetyl esterase
MCKPITYTFLVLFVTIFFFYYISNLEFHSFISSNFTKLTINGLYPKPDLLSNSSYSDSDIYHLAKYTTSSNELKKWRYQINKADQGIAKGTIYKQFEYVKRIVNLDFDEERSVRLYIPHDSKFYPKGTLKGVNMWIHGGGFVFGTIQTNDIICKTIANQTGAIVISVSYRLAPENKFPSAIDDVESILRWLTDTSSNNQDIGIHSYGGDSNNIVISGEGTGGNLAASLVASAVSATLPFTTINISSSLTKSSITINSLNSIKGIILICPSLHYGEHSNSHKQYKNINGMLTLDQMEWFYTLYLNDNHRDCSDFRACPMRIPDQILSSFPDTVIISAKNDILRDEGEIFNNKLIKAGSNSIFHEYNNSIHGFFGLNSQDGIDSLQVYTNSIFKMLKHSKKIKNYKINKYKNPKKKKSNSLNSEF